LKISEVLGSLETSISRQSNILPQSGNHWLIVNVRTCHSTFVDFPQRQ